MKLDQSVLSISLFLGSASLLPAVGILVDSNFDANPNSAWTTFNNAFPDEVVPGIDAGIEGAETLKMFGNFTGGENFSGAFQDIAVDGAVLSVGDSIQLTAFMMHLSTDDLDDTTVRAFVEFTFVDTTGSLGEFGFGANASAALTGGDATDMWNSYSTPVAPIPAEANFVRIKAVFVQDDQSFAGGAAWVEGMELTVVPEPSSTALLGIGGLAFAMRRRR